MATFFEGQKVRVAGFDDPGTIISGPHKNATLDRWLVRSADGNVMLLPHTTLSPVDDSTERVADIISKAIFNSGMAERGPLMAAKLRKAADAVVAELKTSSGPLRDGDKIRILERRYHAATVEVGDVLTVRNADAGFGDFATDAPRSGSRSEWYFPHDGEGTGWERA